jgi:hypothetical protein
MYLFEHIYSYFTSHTTQRIVALVFVLCAFRSANAANISSNGDVNTNSVSSDSSKYIEYQCERRGDALPNPAMCQLRIIIGGTYKIPHNK